MKCPSRRSGPGTWQGAFDWDDFFKRVQKAHASSDGITPDTDESNPYIDPIKKVTKTKSRSKPKSDKYKWIESKHDIRLTPQDQTKSKMWSAAEGSANTNLYHGTAYSKGTVWDLYIPYGLLQLYARQSYFEEADRIVALRNGWIATPKNPPTGNGFVYDDDSIMTKKEEAGEPFWWWELPEIPENLRFKYDKKSNKIINYGYYHIIRQRDYVGGQWKIVGYYIWEGKGVPESTARPRGFHPNQSYNRQPEYY